MAIAKIIWIDDEIESLQSQKLFLETKGYEVQTLTNGFDAIDYVKENPVDVVLIDETMPGITGLETLAKIKEVRQQIPIVLITKNETENLMNDAIGSQISDLVAFEAAYRRVAELYGALRAQGLPLRRLDLGGGMGVRYGTGAAFDLDGYAEMLRRVVGGLGAELMVEPGRWLVAEAGLLLTAVIATKESDGRRFLVLDAGIDLRKWGPVWASDHFAVWAVVDRSLGRP